MLAEAEKRLRPKRGQVKFHVGEIDDLSGFADNSFDCYVSTFALHHVEDSRKAQAVAEALRVVKPGGLVVIADEIICDPVLRQDPDLQHAKMKEVFYGPMPQAEFDAKFDGFEEHPTGLTEMAGFFARAGLYPAVLVLNEIVAVMSVRLPEEEPDPALIHALLLETMHQPL
jgi:SAM-dependent methyltransferase